MLNRSLFFKAGLIFTSFVAALSLPLLAEGNDNSNLEADASSNDLGSQNEPNQKLMDTVKSEIKKDFKNYNINVHVFAGNVTITGKVDSDKAKKDIESKVSRIKGVKKVYNEILVQKPQPNPTGSTGSDFSKPAFPK